MLFLCIQFGDSGSVWISGRGLIVNSIGRPDVRCKPLAGLSASLRDTRLLSVLPLFCGYHNRAYDRNNDHVAKRTAAKSILSLQVTFNAEELPVCFTEQAPSISFGSIFVGVVLLICTQ